MDKLWFYARAGKDKQGPVTESELRALVARGLLKPKDLVWSEGMANWTPLNACGELRPAEEAVSVPPPSSTPAVPVSLSADSLPPGLEGWMTLVGVVHIISGIFACIGCISAVSGIFMILSGSAMLAAKNALGAVSRVDPALDLFFRKLKTSVQMLGIMYVIGFVVFFIVAAFYFSVIAAALGRIAPSH
jgi:hypothetical protein